MVQMAIESENDYMTDCLSRKSYKATDDGEILVYPHGRIPWVGGGNY